VVTSIEGPGPLGEGPSRRSCGPKAGSRPYIEAELGRMSHRVRPSEARTISLPRTCRRTSVPNPAPHVCFGGKVRWTIVQQALRGPAVLKKYLTVKVCMSHRACEQQEDRMRT
jgi:hypothetical protein